MDSPVYRRVYIEVVTREDLTTRQSIDNLMFGLCEGLVARTALVQLHVVDRSDSLTTIAAGRDMVPENEKLELPSPHPAGDFGHKACLHLACAALNPSGGLNFAEPQTNQDCFPDF